MDELVCAGNARVERLAHAFEQIALTRMAGLPFVHPGLRVETVGFALHQSPEEGGSGMLGVLVTPWCMNLVWLGLIPAGAPTPTTRLATGMERVRALGTERFVFLGAHEAEVGDYESCSLASPMFAFADQAAAVATGRCVLELLRQDQVPAAADAPGSTEPALPARRRFLLGSRSSLDARPR